MPLHPNNKHLNGYDFDTLLKTNVDLSPFVFINKYGTQTIDFANSKAIKALNTALLKTHYNINFWEFPDANLCPPIPGRVDYIHHLADLINPIQTPEPHILDIGTGATCIYPILGVQEYGWQFTATDIDKVSLIAAQQNIDKNDLSEQIELKHQTNKGAILDNIFTPKTKFTACLCNPPFYQSEQEAKQATQRKLKGLDKEMDFKRNFSGTHNELWYKGGEKAFLHNYLYQSSLYKNQCFWFTSLVSKKENIRPMKVSLKKLGVTEVRVIKMEQGNKITHIIAWTFLNPEKKENW